MHGLREDTMRRMIGRLREGLRNRGIEWGVVAGYAALVVTFGWLVAQFYIPTKGFSYLISFGAHQEQSRLSKIRKLEYHVERASDGYDAQYYVQIAMDPSLQNRELRKAVDSLPYRARRILFPAIAFGLGLGEPAWILQAYALENTLSWFVLAVLLLHWFPPANWGNFFRWAGVMFSAGVCLSFRNSLIDGPSLMFIALGLFLLDKGRPGWGAAVLALSGMGKETNLLGAASLLPKPSEGRRAWGAAIVRGILVALPLPIWMIYLQMNVGRVTDAGARNFDWPFVAYVHKWREVLADMPELAWPNPSALWGLLILTSLSVQFLYLVLRPQWEKAWWRVGIGFALLMVFLGDAVWEGYPGAAARVLLPMQLAFNVLVPTGRFWRIVLVAGNLTLLMAPASMQAPPGDGFVLRGNHALLVAASGHPVKIGFSNNWYAPEYGGANYWTWSPGNAAITVFNPHAAPLLMRVRFTLTSEGPRTVILKLNGGAYWQTSLSDDQSVSASLQRVPMAPGLNRIEFGTDAPAHALPPDPRQFAFCLHNLRLDAQELAAP